MSPEGLVGASVQVLRVGPLLPGEVPGPEISSLVLSGVGVGVGVSWVLARMASEVPDGWPAQWP